MAYLAQHPMYTLIALFYISLAGIVLMLLLKRREVRSGVPSIISRLGRGTDSLFHAVFSAVGRVISYVNKHTFIAIAQIVAFHVLRHVRNVYVELKHRALSNPHSRKVVDAVRGRGAVAETGSSLYLRRISPDIARK